MKITVLGEDKIINEYPLFNTLDKRLNALLGELTELYGECVENQPNELQVQQHLLEIGFTIENSIEYEMTKIKLLMQ